jgi:propionate CoA-transferase
VSARTVTADEAAAAIPDGATVATDGFGMMGVPEAVLAAIERSFLARAQPRGLTLVHAAGQSNRVDGIEHLAHAGLVRRVVGSHWGMAPRMSALLAASRAEAVCLPQGQIAQLYQAIAAGRPGILTTIGRGTFVDPRRGGGKVNDAALRSETDHVRLVEVSGETHLLYAAFPIDVAIVRVTSVDEDGNGSCEEEAVWLDALALAQAARTSGGLVICQARRRVSAGTIPPREVVLPGCLVDLVVVAEDAEHDHRQTDASVFDARYVTADVPGGGLTDTLDGDPADPGAGRPAGRLGTDLADVELIGRRAVRLIAAGDVLNLGTGIPGDVVAPAIVDAGLSDRITVTVESGVHGGRPVGGNDFGVAVRPSAIIPHAAQFDLYRGALDVTFMGVGQLDRFGDVNVTSLGGRLIGCGGFIDITQGTPRVYFCARLGGRHAKLVERVEQVSFNAREARARGQEIRYLTELGVFELDDDGLVLVEVALGNGVRERIAALAPFPLRVREPLLSMTGDPDPVAPTTIPAATAGSRTRMDT